MDCVAGVYGPVAPYVSPVPTPSEPPTADQNKQLAVKLLQQTDWANQPDVVNPPSGPKLLNQTAFLNYRATLRQIAVYPQAGFLNWPTKPAEQWA